MKCPLSKSIIRVGGEASIGTMVDCLKEECAWWNEWSQVCAVKMGQVNLGSIADSLDVIMEKMPHEEQFRK